MTNEPEDKFTFTTGCNGTSESGLPVFDSQPVVSIAPDGTMTFFDHDSHVIANTNKDLSIVGGGELDVKQSKQIIRILLLLISSQNTRGF